MLNRTPVFILVAAVLLVGGALAAAGSGRDTDAGSDSVLFPTGAERATFDSLRAAVLAQKAHLDTTAAPSQAGIRRYIDRLEAVRAYNTRLIDDRFTVDTTAAGRRRSLLPFLGYAVATAHAGVAAKEARYGFRWEELVERVRDRAAEPITDAELVFYADELLSVLDDAHTWISYGGSPLLRSLAVEVEPDSFRVTGYYRGLESDRISLGDRLLSIDGVRAPALYRDVRNRSLYADYPATEELFARRFFRSYYFYRLREARPDTATLRFRKPDGSAYTLELAWRPVRRIRSMYGVWIHKEDRVGIRGQTIADGRYGYIRIDRWDVSYLATFDSLVASMNDTEAILLDVRNNFGGDYTTFGQHVLSTFLPRDTVTLYKRFRNSDLYHLYGFHKLHYRADREYAGDYYPPVPVATEGAAETTYGGDLVLLVDQKHFSSNDLFITAYRELGLGAIVGRLNPFQLSGQPIRIDLPWNGWRMGLSVMVPLAPSGTLYEDRTIEPDVVVPLTDREIRGEADPILQAALAYCTGRPGPGGEP